MPNPDMRNMADIYPHRGDQVEAWLKDRRDQYSHPETGTPMEANQYVAWTAIDNLLDEWRLASDTGQSLEEVVNGEHERPPQRAKKKPQLSDDFWVQRSPAEGPEF